MSVTKGKQVLELAKIWGFLSFAENSAVSFAYLEDSLFFFKLKLGSSSFDFTTRYVFPQIVFLGVSSWSFVVLCV